MKKEKNPVIITRQDFDLLKPFIGTKSKNSEEMSLAYELGRAIVVKNDACPPHTIKLNSTVTIIDLETQKTAKFTIVMPKHADISVKKISVITPMGAALIGFRKGEEVEWIVPGGFKKFMILDVINS